MEKATSSCNRIYSRSSESDALDSIVISTDVEAAGVLIELVTTRVPLDDVAHRAFLDVHTLVSISYDGVTHYEVINAVVGRVVCPLQKRSERNHVRGDWENIQRCIAAFPQSNFWILGMPRREHRTQDMIDKT